MVVEVGEEGREVGEEGRVVLGELEFVIVGREPVVIESDYVCALLTATGAVSPCAGRRRSNDPDLLKLFRTLAQRASVVLALVETNPWVMSSAAS